MAASFEALSKHSMLSLQCLLIRPINASWLRVFVVFALLDVIFSSLYHVCIITVVTRRPVIIMNNVDGGGWGVLLTTIINTSRPHYDPLTSHHRYRPLPHHHHNNHRPRERIWLHVFSRTLFTLPLAKHLLDNNDMFLYYESRHMSSWQYRYDRF